MVRPEDVWTWQTGTEMYGVPSVTNGRNFKVDDEMTYSVQMLLKFELHVYDECITASGYKNVGL